MMPVTFTRRLSSTQRAHVATITTREDGKRLPRDIQAHCAYVLATNCVSHAKAIEQIIELGLAEDAADADQLIQDGEGQQL